jgi:hypothetical protein
VFSTGEKIKVINHVETLIPHLFIQLVPHCREHGCPCPVIWDDSFLDIPAASKLVKVLTRVGSLVKLIQQVCCCLYATLSKAVVLVTNILHGYLELLHSKLGGFPQAVNCVFRLLSFGLKLN